MRTSAFPSKSGAVPAGHGAQVEIAFDPPGLFVEARGKRIRRSAVALEVDSQDPSAHALLNTIRLALNFE
jgi:hypothetical protein